MSFKRTAEFPHPSSLVYNLSTFCTDGKRCGCRAVNLWLPGCPSGDGDFHRFSRVETFSPSRSLQQKKKKHKSSKHKVCVWHPLTLCSPLPIGNNQPQRALRMSNSSPPHPFIVSGWIVSSSVGPESLLHPQWDVWKKRGPSLSRYAPSPSRFYCFTPALFATQSRPTTLACNVNTYVC